MKKSYGFTFIESLFHLFVLILFSQFFGYMYLWFHEIDKQFPLQETTWEMFVYELQEYIDQSDKITLSNQNRTLNLYNEETRETTQISRYGDMIRKQVNNTGHVPLFIGVKDVNFVKNENNITVFVELLNGEKKERSLFVGQIEK